MKNVQKNMEKVNGRYRTFLLSDQNIYHAIYSLRSYIFDFELLEEEDKRKYYHLQDKFDEVYIKRIICEVRSKITELIDEKDSFIETEVYFRPKKLNEGGGVIYRPLHTTDLISQIAIVAMLHLFVYEIADKEKQLYLSDMSRLLPGNFYGNRVSLNPETLFKPWRQQYQRYTQNANEALKKYSNSLEYKYEVTLDLENFYPTIDPGLVYRLIVERLPINIDSSDKELLKKLLIKLLVCKLKTKLSDKLKNEYYKIKGKKEEYFFEESFVCGIPQGLPQSYFFGNICMIPIAEIFQKEFQGISYFYVDDSVIFTNDVREDEFGKQLEDINNEIEKMETQLLKKVDLAAFPDCVAAMRRAGLYGIQVHTLEKNVGVSKSSFTRLDQLDKSEVYLKCVSREASQVGIDIFKMYSDEEDVIVEKRMEVMSDEIQKKIDDLNKKLEQLKKLDKKESHALEDSNANKKRIQSLSKFRDRWIRYYRFFEYRKQHLKLRRMCEMDHSGKKELEEIIYAAKKKDTAQDKLESFIQSYNENIWDAAVNIYCEYADEENKQTLGRYIEELNTLCFGGKNKTSSFLYKKYEELIQGENERNGDKTELRDPYRTLRNCAAWKLKKFSNKHYQVAEEWVEQILKSDWKNEILKNMLSQDMINMAEIVNANTSQFLRMVANTVYSQLFSVEIEDCFEVRKINGRPIRCGEFRILLFLRNRLFTEEMFLKQKILLKDPNNKEDLDYTLMEVIGIFQSFVVDPIRIDKLVLTHQYTCQVWKNGSKHLYFYTLHNQEHAIVLIRNIVKLIHAISFLKVSSLDFYILFLACYLHDISMVKILALDVFLTDKESGDSIAWEQLKEFNELFMEDISQVKKWMTQSYRKLDAYYEKQIRGRHALDSAAEIRTREDLDFLDTTLREFVAEISEAHQADERDIYFTKSSAADKKISLKFDKILLRLADLLDMGNGRISRPILHHNLDQMSEESAFHWISHLLTQGYELSADYDKDENVESLTPKSIVEKLLITIVVDMSQMSKYKCEQSCQKIGIKNIDDDGFELHIGNRCEDGDEVCNFLCKWFSEKNAYLMKELFALKEYLNRVPDNFFGFDIIIRVKIANRTSLDEKQFGILEHYLKNKGN